MENNTTNIWKSSKMGPNSCSSMSVVRSATQGAGVEPQQQQRNVRIPSNSSLNEGSACALTHQYHYIQYPAYYQLIHDPLEEHAPATAQPISTCLCPCSCRKMPGNTIHHITGRHMHQNSSDDSQVAVAVTVHQQDGDGGQNQQVAKTKSEQSLLNHSYQALNAVCDEEKQLNLAETTGCDCDLECTCSVALPSKSKRSASGGMSALMLAADEITVSESDNNSTMVKRKSRDGESGNDNKKVNTWCEHQDNIIANSRGDCEKKTRNNNRYSTSQIDIYSDGEGDGTDSCLKINNGGLSEDDQRPPLPPRPPPRPRNVIVNINAHRSGSGGIKKYVVWCLICGGFSCLLGVLFLGVYFLLHSYTITVGNFETVPTFVPATLLILTGLCIMSLARRRNRYSYLIKLSGACGLISALTCALVTVTTTVLHMSRLQALRECEYAQKTRTCTCYSDMGESQVERVDKEGVRLVFDSLSDCGVVHGSLYSCLRAIFGLSVAGVLIAVFSCMLVYQLLSHERKKMYWEQLELRCRSLYTSQQGPPPPNMAAIAGGRANVCRCCEQCHAHRQVPLQPSAYPWDDGSEPRFWTGQPPGNFYSPNPGGHDLQNNSVAMPDGTCRGHGLASSRSRVTTGWSWPRMPWQRSSPVSSNRFRQTPSSPDSQYGFSNAPPQPTEVVLSDEQAFNDAPPNANLPFGVWGPPPPYSNPNSPARRGYYQFMHHPNGCLSTHTDRQSTTSSAEQHMSRNECRSAHRSAFGMDQQLSDVSYCAQTASMRNLSKRQGGSTFKTTSTKGDYENTPSDSDGGARDRFSNTLPTRKMKKRVEAGAKSIGPNSQPAQRVNVQHVFSNAHCTSDGNGDKDAHAYHDPVEAARGLNIENIAVTNCINARSCVAQAQTATQRHKVGVENSAFQRSAECGSSVIDTGVDAHTHEHCDPTESEVYFADVSSCCNVSVKNDNYYDDANQSHTVLVTPNEHRHNHRSSSQLHLPNGGHHKNDEDYLAHRFGQRENSIRSRLPFPQTCNDDYDRESTAANHQSNSTTCNMQKEISRQSMCSVESEAKTEFTDLSPATPCSGNSFAATHGDPSSIDDHHHLDDASATTTRKVSATNTFVASFPYLAESQSLEAYRRSTKNLSNEQQQQKHQMVTEEAQYEVISDAAASCKALNFPVASNARSSKGAHPQRPNTLRTTVSANATKSMLKDVEKSQTQYQADVDWSDSSSCPNDRQHL